jgi:hypothetical protein
MTNSDRDLLIETSTNVKWIRETMVKQDSRLDSHAKQIGWIKRYVYMFVGAVGLLEFFRMRS